MLLAGGAMSVVGVQSYLDSRHAAQAAFAQLTDDVAAADTGAADVSTEAVTLVSTAQTTLAEADGKTLDGVAQGAVRAAVSVLESTVPEIQAEANAIAEQATALQASFDELLLWPPNASEKVKAVGSTLDLTLWETAKESLNLALKQLEAARAAWQAEQDRIATEEAAAAAARAAARASSSTLSESGGSTAPSAVQITDPAVDGYDAESVLRSYANASLGFVWQSGLCKPNTLCGTTRLADGVQPLVTLDSNVREYYATNAGQYVIVHEAAHVRQGYRYSTLSELFAASLAATGFAAGQERAAVERLADCATYVRIGMVVSTFTYLQGSSCTASELAEAATYW